MSTRSSRVSTANYQYFEFGKDEFEQFAQAVEFMRELGPPKLAGRLAAKRQPKILRAPILV